jgi:hypothetical protein
MSTSSSKKSNTNIRKGRDGVRAYRPGLQDFKRTQNAIIRKEYIKHGKEV